VSWWATSGRKPEETPSIEQAREPKRARSRDRKDGTETIPPDSREDAVTLRSGRRGWNGHHAGCKGKLPPMNACWRWVVAR